jgi:hypothetical protein
MIVRLSAAIFGGFLALMACAHAARAADLPAKAPTWTGGVGSTCTPTSCTGPYIGGGLGGVGTNIDVIGNGLAGSAAAGGMLPTVDVGYIYASGNWLFAIEADFAYQTQSSASVNGVSANQSGFLLTQGVKMGGNIQALLGTNAVPPVTIPPSLANAVINVYLQGGAAEHQIAGSNMASGGYTGVGVLLDTGPHSFVDIDYKNIQYGHVQSGAGSFNQEQIVKAGWNYKF